jgi:hypothetical protein
MQLGLAASLLLVLSGCITCAMWGGVDHNCGEKAAAVALTPVTVAVDAALFPVEIVAAACDHGHCCHRHRYRDHCR